MSMVVIGAGQAGFTCVETMRKSGYTGPITLIGEESEPPYQRPPLSKAYLLGDMARERLYFRPETYYADNDITLVTAQRVTGINLAEKSINLANGGVISYDKLALTTGATPRRLPAAIGGDLGNVFCVRTLADVDKMAGAFCKNARLLIIGGGYIGLEAAAVAVKFGVQVTVVEMAPRILQRVAAPETSAYFRALHLANGVEILEGVGLTKLTGDKVVTGAMLTDGRSLEVDFVIAGVGVEPDTTLALYAELKIENGIQVNAHCQTSIADIYAAGDCASIPLNGQQVRIESVGNAIDMAAVMAANMLGGNQTYTPKPWFWSDQYDTKLQIAGLNTGYDNVVVRGTGRAVSHWYYQGNQLLAVDAMNDPRAYMIGKRLIEAGKSPDPEIIRTAADLKPLLKA